MRTGMLPGEYHPALRIIMVILLLFVNGHVVVVFAVEG
jgi:hypothetical protein